MPKELENYPKIQGFNKAWVGDLKISCGAKDFRCGTKSRCRVWR